MARRVRYRPRPNITPFQAGITPSLDEAQFDRIDLQFNSGRIAFSSPSSRRGFLELLAGTGPFQIPRYNAQRISVKTNSDAVASFKLSTSGAVDLSVERHTARQTVSIERARTSVDLVVSLTRLLAHAPNDTVYEEATAVSTLLRHPEITERLSALSLDGSDNFLPLEQWRTLRPFFPASVNALSNLLNGFSELLETVSSEDGLPPSILAEPFDQRIRSAAELGDFDALVDLPWSNWIMRRCEVFWEYRVPDAISFVHHLRPALFAVSKDTLATDYDLPPARPYREPGRGRWRQLRNAISVIATTNNRYVEIAVYAKEYDRLRFEVRYLRNVRQIFGSRATQNRFATSFDGLVTMLDFLRNDARERLERLLSALPDVSLRLDNPLHLYSSAIAAVARAGTGNPFAVERVLLLLLMNGGISPTGDDRIDQMIIQLLCDGILVLTRPDQRTREPRYILAEPYGSALTAALEGVDRRQFR